MAKTTKEKIEIMQAYEMGEQIQINNSNNIWEDIETPIWDWVNCNYRIKPKNLDKIIKPEFKDGDILFIESFCSWVLIYRENKNEESIYKYVAVSLDTPSFLMFTNKYSPVCRKQSISEIRFATDDEKQKLFDIIKTNGYNWNAKTKTLEKLIKPNKFDITTLKPFDKVLMRSSNAREWDATLFSHYSNNKFYGCGMCCDQCIPYEENKHLLGTTNDCDEFYKNWE